MVCVDAHVDYYFSVKRRIGTVYYYVQQRWCFLISGVDSGHVGLKSTGQLILRLVRSAAVLELERNKIGWFPKLRSHRDNACFLFRFNHQYISYPGIHQNIYFKISSRFIQLFIYYVMENKKKKLARKRIELMTSALLARRSNQLS